ncbi:MAG: hypothetical protein RR497_02300 [Oscillospiraceae bacterium]
MKKSTVIFYSAFAALLALYLFFAAPNLNPMYSDGAFFWLVVLTVASIVPAIGSLKAFSFKIVDGQPKFSWNKEAVKVHKWIIILVGALWVVFFAITIIFTPLFFSKSYKNQLPEPTVKDFNAEVQAIDISKIPIVDKALASTLADKKLGEKESLGSQVILGEPTIQMVDGDLVWVVPLHHSGFFKWLSNMDGAAGYVKVSATNLQDVSYVENYKIKIQPNSFFLDDLERKARFSGGLFTGMTDYSFELDDSGNPYWVVTTYKPTCGFALPEATGVIVVDAQTGTSQKYTIENLPEWVDRVQPEDFIINQINNKGEYVNGIFNFSDKDKFKTSKGQNVVYNNGNCYLFTGATSVGADESALGFYMVDMVTKEPILYKMGGATEYSAMDSAQGKVQDLRYEATFPIILNINDEPTYFMTLKDSAKLIKKYAFVSIKDYMMVGIGDTVTNAKDDYLNVLANAGAQLDLNKAEEIKTEQVQGVIERISWNILDNVTTYSFTLENNPNIYIVPADKSIEIALTQKGDAVTIDCKKANETVYQVTKFDNAALPAKK